MCCPGNQMAQIILLLCAMCCYVYRRILGSVYDNENENWRMLSNKEICAMVKKPHYNRDNKVK